MMKNNFIAISVLMAIMIFSISGVQASALGQLQQQASGQNCFDQGCSGNVGDSSGNNAAVPGAGTEYSPLNDFWAQLRAAGNNFVSNIPTLMESLNKPLFAGLWGR